MPTEIKTYDDFMDTILELVSATEANEEFALMAAVTIGALKDKGHDKLAFEVLETYRPGDN